VSRLDQLRVLRAQFTLSETLKTMPTTFGTDLADLDEDHTHRPFLRGKIVLGEARAFSRN